MDEKTLDTLLQPSLAYDWDNVGLQIGTLSKAIDSVLIALDVTMEVVQEAIESKCQLIIAHHPLLFRGVKQILPSQPIGRLIEALIKSDIALYVAHTNYDLLEGGMNHALADLLGLKHQEPLEMVDDTHGLGRLGLIPEKQSLGALAKDVLSRFDIEDCQLIGSKDQMVHKVAIVGGSGSSVIPAALSKDVDVLITGDITYHHALDAKAMGLSIININHNVEARGLNQLKVLLEKEIPSWQFKLSTCDTNPYLSIKKEA